MFFGLVADSLAELLHAELESLRVRHLFLELLLVLVLRHFHCEELQLGQGQHKLTDGLEVGFSGVLQQGQAFA